MTNRGVQRRRPGARSRRPRQVDVAVLFAAAAGACGSGEAPVVPLAGETFHALVADHETLGAANRLELARADEPGRRLVIYGRLVDRQGRPLAALPIRVFQTNAAGDYEESVPGDESTARLSGNLTSGPDGRFVLSTILPGGYGGEQGSAGHIHTEVAGADPETYDFHFDPYIGGGLRRWAERSRQAVILDLLARGDTLVAVADLPVRLAGPRDR